MTNLPPLESVQRDLSAARRALTEVRGLESMVSDSQARPGQAPMSADKAASALAAAMSTLQPILSRLQQQVPSLEAIARAYESDGQKYAQAAGTVRANGRSDAAQDVLDASRVALDNAQKRRALATEIRRLLGEASAIAGASGAPTASPAMAASSYSEAPGQSASQQSTSPYGTLDSSAYQSSADDDRSRHSRGCLEDVVRGGLPSLLNLKPEPDARSYACVTDPFPGYHPGTYSLGYIRPYARSHQNRTGGLYEPWIP